MKFTEKNNFTFGYAWWRDLEALREKKKSFLTHEPTVSGDACLRYYPDYPDNPYQNMLYRASIVPGWSVEPVDLADIVGICERFLKSSKRIFHIHWLLEVFFQDGAFLSQSVISSRIARMIGIIRIFKSIGVKIVWTAHNKIEHDLPENLIPANAYLIGEIVKLVDLVIVHVDMGMREIEEVCGISCRHKAVIIEHPLYENSRLNPENHKRPPEMNWKAQSEYALSLGMIRQYKGMRELIYTYKLIIREIKNAKLVIAGALRDHSIGIEARIMADMYPENLLFIPRRLEEEEVNYLYANCNFSLLTYKAILTSGSYYMAATHSKCSLAPRMGMFKEIVKDGINGYMYDRHGEGLLQKLRMIYSADGSELTTIGKQAREHCKYGPEGFSSVFYKAISDLK